MNSRPIWVRHFAYLSTYLGIETVTTRWDIFWSSMCNEVLAHGTNSNVAWMIAFEAVNELGCQGTAQKRIFTIGFLKLRSHKSQNTDLGCRLSFFCYNMYIIKSAFAYALFGIISSVALLPVVRCSSVSLSYSSLVLVSSLTAAWKVNVVIRI